MSRRSGRSNRAETCLAAPASRTTRRRAEVVVRRVDVTKDDPHDDGWSKRSSQRNCQRRRRPSEVPSPDVRRTQAISSARFVNHQPAGRHRSWHCRHRSIRRVRTTRTHFSSPSTPPRRTPPFAPAGGASIRVPSRWPVHRTTPRTANHRCVRSPRVETSSEPTRGN